jgi:plasmid stabilization system protein ParE
MRCTVVWAPDAEDHLAEIWIASANRIAVTVAANHIDAQLAENPLGKATPLHEGLYVFTVPPLHVIFTIEEADCLVRILVVTTDESANGPPPTLPTANGEILPPG